MGEFAVTQKILIATTNQGKVRELRSLLTGVDFTLISLQDLPASMQDEVEETGSTFADNAERKARAYGQRSGLPTVADDSGLEVTALHGAPGVQSARWLAGSDTDRVAGLLRSLADTNDRSAQFVSVVCYYDPRTNNQQLFTGTVRGRLATKPRGSDGFGYDPIFIPTGYDQTFAELGTATKNTISHRAQAMRQLVQFLTTERVS